MMRFTQLTDDAIEFAKPKVYVGIGSRVTPKDVLTFMTRTAQHLAGRGWTLRTGGGDGADTAFRRGVANTKLLELYYPWPGFDARMRPTLTRPTRAAYELSKGYHPTWNRLGNAAKALHARNAHQVLGPMLDAPASFVLCWTPDGGIEITTTNTGGTGQAIRIAVGHGIPVFNLARADHREMCEALLVA